MIGYNFNKVYLKQNFSSLLYWYYTLYLNIKDLMILRSYFNTFTLANIKRLGELTCEENDMLVEGGLF